jgi:hypothetical protein
MNKKLYQNDHPKSNQATVGHFGLYLGPNEFLTSKRKTDFNKMEEVGLVEVNDKIILRMNKFLYSKNIKIDELILKELHNDLVKHYLQNQNVLIGDDLND